MKIRSVLKHKAKISILSTMQEFHFNGTVLKLSHSMTKPTKWHVRPAKTQISLGIRPV